MFVPAVGKTVQWYVGGNTGAAPFPAIIVAVFPNGMLSLSVCTGNNWIFKQSVYNKDSKVVRENPKMSHRDGCWGEVVDPYVPEQKKAEEPKVNKSEKLVKV